jgi:hypothetical protein
MVQVLGQSNIINLPLPTGPNNLTANFTAQSVGALINPIIPAETAVGVTAVNYLYPPGYWDRYGTNTNPGVTDMGPAIQTSINVALAANGGGHQGIPSRGLYGAYAVATLPTFGTLTNLQSPIDFGGMGKLSTQIYYTGTASPSAGFLFTFPSGVYAHDFMMACASASKCGGISVDGTTTAATFVLLERIASRMAGIGFQFKNTNTNVIRDCEHWSDNNTQLIIPQTVTQSDINHGIYGTGGYVNDISVYDFRGACSPNYASGQRWIKVDATDYINFRIRGGLPVNESPGAGPTHSQKMLELGNASGGSHGYGAEVIGVYHQSGYLEFNNCTCGTITSNTDGGAGDSNGVGLNFQLNSLANFIGPNSESENLAFDSTSGSNVIVGGSYAGFTDLAATAPNQYVSPSRSASYGGLIYSVVTYSTSITPNAGTGNYFEITATNNTNFTVNLPTNISPGPFWVQINATTTLGVITFSSAYKMATNTPTPPASGNKIIVACLYDGTHANQVGAITSIPI